MSGSLRVSVLVAAAATAPMMHATAFTVWQQHGVFTLVARVRRCMAVEQQPGARGSRLKSDSNGGRCLLATGLTVAHADECCCAVQACSPAVLFAVLPGRYNSWIMLAVGLMVEVAICTCGRGCKSASMSCGCLFRLWGHTCCSGNPTALLRSRLPHWSSAAAARCRSGWGFPLSHAQEA